MTINNLPLSDLELLHKEIGSKTPSAALPSQLSDYWLELIARDLDVIVGDYEPVGEDPDIYAAAPLALIIQILSSKLGDEPLEISMEEMFEYMCDYRIEINLEIVNRRTSVKTEQATLETIFTGREVKRLG